LDAIEHLKKKDKRLGAAIDQIGPIQRKTEDDLFSGVVHHIVGQQISMAAQATIWGRMQGLLGKVSADTICLCSREELQSCGISFRKADYILGFAQKVQSGEFNIEALWDMSDKDVIASLSSLNGIGVWTAEMLLIFCMQRPDVVSYGDFAIRRGMQMLYRHRKLDKEQFTKYARRYSPYGSVASLYLWAIAGGAIPELDYPE
jgi:DNA-3-methyladenine glycosylase II